MNLLKYLNSRKYGLVMTALIFCLIGCDSDRNGEIAPVTPCGSNQAAPGEVVTCSVPKDFRDDCTCFVGSRPAVCEINTEGDLEIRVPNARGSTGLSYLCGAEPPKTIAADFKVELPAAPAPKPTPAPSPAPDLLPPAPPLARSPAPDPTPAPAPAPTPAPDPTPAASPAPAPDPERPGAAPAAPEVPAVPELGVTLTVDGPRAGRVGYNQVLGLTRVDWSVHGGGHLQNLYLFAPFNRLSDDGWIDHPGDPNAPCELTADGRFLAVRGNGDEIHEGSEDADPIHGFGRYLSGTECNNNDDCYNFNRPTPPPSEPRRGGGVVLIGQPSRFSVVGNPIYRDLLRLNSTPTCRIDLQGTSGHFFTRIHTSSFRVVIAAQSQSEDGTWKTDEKTLQLPEPAITSNPDSVVQILDSAPQISLNFDYANSPHPPVVSGCLGVAGGRPLNTHDNVRGTGSYSTTCQLQKDSLIKITLTGADPSHSQTETYKVECSNPEIKMSNGALYQEASRDAVLCSAQGDGWWLNCHEHGEVQLYGEVSRSCTVKRETEDGFVDLPGYPRKFPWVKSLRLTGDSSGWGSCPGFDWVDLTDSSVTLEAGKAKIARRITRSHQCTNYSLAVRDLDGTLLTAHSISFPYKKEFTVSDVGGSCQHTYTSCDAQFVVCWDSEGSCHEVKNRTVHYELSWAGRHIKGIEADCNQGGESIEQPDHDSYDFQSKAKAFHGEDSHLDGGDGWEKRCSIKATYYDNSTLVWDAHWSCHC